MEMSNKMNADFMPAGQIFIQPTDETGILTSESSYVRHTFHKATDAIDSDSSDGSGQSKLKTFCKGFIILDSTFVTHGKRSEYQYPQKFGRGSFQPS